MCSAHCLTKANIDQSLMKRRYGADTKVLQMDRRRDEGFPSPLHGRGLIIMNLGQIICHDICRSSSLSDMIQGLYCI